MFDRLDFWVTTLSLLLLAVGLVRYFLQQLRRPAGHTSEPTTRPTTRPTSRRAIESTTRPTSRRTRTTPTAHVRPTTAHTGNRWYKTHTGHTAPKSSMPDIDAKKASMEEQPAIPPPAEEIPPKAAPQFDRDTRIRVLLDLGWSGNKIAAELGGDRNTLLKRVKELKAEQV